MQTLLRLIGLHLIAHVSDYGAPQWQQPQKVKGISPQNLKIIIQLSIKIH